MFPLQIAGLALAGRVLLTKYNVHSQPSNKRQFTIKPPSIPIKELRFRPRPIFKDNPVQLLFKGLSSALAQRPKRSSATLDYDSVVRSFMPADAEILTPKYPLNSRQYLVTDLDDDSHDEIIASYKERDGVVSIVLKQQSGNWHKVSEIKHPDYQALHYRGVAKLSDDGKKQLLIGLIGNGSDKVLYCHSMKDNNIQTLFSRNYHRLELVNQQRQQYDSLNQQLAIWERKDDDTYNIDVLHLRNNQMETVDNAESYFSTKVLPYYIRKVKQSPYAAANWYNLAEALVRQKAYRDAQIAIEVGNRLDVNSAFREKFDYLKSRLVQAVK